MQNTHLVLFSGIFYFFHAQKFTFLFIYNNLQIISLQQFTIYSYTTIYNLFIYNNLQFIHNIPVQESHLLLYSYTKNFICIFKYSHAILFWNIAIKIQIVNADLIFCALLLELLALNSHA